MGSHITQLRTLANGNYAKGFIRWDWISLACGPSPLILCEGPGWISSGWALPDSDVCLLVVQGALRPILLRRMKEDVETLPEKEEVRPPSSLSMYSSICSSFGWLRRRRCPALAADATAPCSRLQVIIWVELTREQRAYYRGLYNRDIGTLLSGASNKNLPNMRNLAMELRKVCCHPVSS